MNSYLVLLIVLLVLIIGLVNKVNCYDSFITGVKEGSKNVINMFSFFLTFNICITLLINSGIIDLFHKKFAFSYGIILVQMLIRPVSASSSLSIMINCYEIYGADSLISIISTFVHSVCDTTFYIVSFYLSYISINTESIQKVLKRAIYINIFGYIVSILIISILRIIINMV